MAQVVPGSRAKSDRNLQPQVLAWEADPIGFLPASLPNQQELRKALGPILTALLMSVLMRRLVVLCFPNAGSAEDMYTSEGTGRRRAPSPLLVHQHHVQALWQPHLYSGNDCHIYHDAGMVQKESWVVLSGTATRTQPSAKGSMHHVCKGDGQGHIHHGGSQAGAAALCGEVLAEHSHLLFPSVMTSCKPDPAWLPLEMLSFLRESIMAPFNRICQAGNSFNLFT